MSWASSAVGTKAAVVADLEGKAATEAGVGNSSQVGSDGAALPADRAEAQAAALVAALPGLLATVGGDDANVFVSINGHAVNDASEEVVTLTIRVRTP